MKQAALLIIGDEILSGKFADENAPFLIRRLRTLGCRVRRVAILSDIVQDIAQETARSSADCDYVFTTGGVGPTHDDITMRSIAAAFDIPLESHPRLEQVLREKIKGELTTAAMRMAQVPKGSELWWDGGMTFPLPHRGHRELPSLRRGPPPCDRDHGGPKRRSRRSCEGLARKRTQAHGPADLEGLMIRPAF